MIKYCRPTTYAPIAVSCFFKPIIADTNGSTNFQKIISIICRYCEVTRHQLSGVSRKKELVEARHIAIYFGYKYGKKITSIKLGEYFNRDHSTILYALKCVKRFIDVDPEFKSKFDFLKREILKIQ